MFFQTSYMSPRDISSRWGNTPMRDYSTWNLKIVPFVFRVYQRVFIYIVDLYTLRYLSKHSVIKIDLGDIHLKLLYLTTVFLSTMFPEGRSFLFIAEWLWVFFPSGIHVPWRFSDVDVVTSDTFNFACHTFSIAQAFPLHPTYLAVFSLTLPQFDWIRLLEQSLNCNTSLLNYFNLETLPLYFHLILLL